MFRQDLKAAPQHAHVWGILQGGEETTHLSGLSWRLAGWSSDDSSHRMTCSTLPIRRAKRACWLSRPADTEAGHNARTGNWGGSPSSKLLHAQKQRNQQVAVLVKQCLLVMVKGVLDCGQSGGAAAWQVQP